ncbi:MAG TPA: metallophosphoesterase [Acidimicrobiales bacterium]|nr:metallophosphoesterase [Acidimicrobiales bacterium]
MELTTVTDTEAVLHDGPRVVRVDGLRPGRQHTVEGVTFRTLPRLGERLATVVTVTDVHIGETECGRYEGVNLGPPLRSEPGEPPYPETMARAAAEEIVARRPDAVVAKGDLTAWGAAEEMGTFLSIFEPAFSDRLHWTYGNHDVSSRSELGPCPAHELIAVEGARVALLDTAVPAQVGGRVTAEQLEWLDSVGADGDTPVLVFGHHPVYDHTSFTAGINPEDSDRLVELFARRSALVGYFAGHTHRNLVRRLPATGELPWAEVGATKDYPGVWAEYRVHEGGIAQVVHRISSPEALAWTDRTREMFGGLYPSYSFGTLADRCFVVPRRVELAS